MNTKISKKELFKFGITFGITLPIFFGILIPILFNHNFKYWTFLVGIIFIIIANLSPKILLYPYKFWMKFGEILGWINSRIILAFVFIFVLLPIALIMKFRGYDPLRIKSISPKTYKVNKKDYLVDLNKIF